MKLVHEVQRIDENGEVQRSATVTTITKLPKEPDYIKLYIDDIGHLLGLQEGHRSILLYIAASVGYDGFVTLTLARKTRIAATVGMAVKTVDNAITAMVKLRILRRDCPRTSCPAGIRPSPAARSRRRRYKRSSSGESRNTTRAAAARRRR